MPTVSGGVTPVQLVIGPPGNGVVEYSRDVAASIAKLLGRPSVVAVSNVAEAEHVAERSARVHLHVADRVFGASAEASAEAVERLARVCSVTVTLHDLPQHSDGPVNLPRRAHAYRRIAAAAQAVAVSSMHEARLFEEAVGTEFTRPAVIPLGTRRRRVSAAPRSPQAVSAGVDIAGYFYPGKGHDAVIAAMSELGGRGGRSAPRVLAGLGAVSVGHEAEYDAMVAAARVAGIDFSMSGYLRDDEYHSRLATAGIPVAAHTHVSASRSILDWIEAGRRPLVAATRYTRELAELRPGVVSLYEPGCLASALERASSVPELTRLAPGTDLGFSLADAAAAYAHWWADEVAW